MREQRDFLRLCQKFGDSTPVDEVRALLGEPDWIGGADPEAGIDFVWEYHDRLPEDRDLTIGFANNRVAFSSFRHMPDPIRREEMRNRSPS
jgi:hypothetical protein